MQGHRFHELLNEKGKTPFQTLLDVFMELLVHTSGDVSESLNWLNQLDRRYGLTTPDYTMADFMEDLKREGYLRDDPEGDVPQLTARTEQGIRSRSLDQVFGKLRKSRRGSHRSPHTGPGEDNTADRRPWEFGDSLEQIAMTDSLRNAQQRHGPGDFHLTDQDLEVESREYKTQVSTVLMIDISHSMILYGEDRITPAKKTAMALAELITKQYPQDTLDILVFGNDAWTVEIKDLPYLQVGPYHTNTVAGLELAMDLLRRRKNPNKQIFMITDGKPTCIREGGGYYKNSYGLDRKIVNRTLNLAAQCRRLHIPITTFMIAEDPWLQEFVQEFTRVNQGKAFYSSLQGLGEFIFEDFQRNRRRKVR